MINSAAKLFLESTVPNEATYPLGEVIGPEGECSGMALLALSHTRPEDKLYRAMLAEIKEAGDSSVSFSIKGLKTLSGTNSSTSLRRSLSGLVRKLSVQTGKTVSPGREESEAFSCRVFKPAEIFQRRIDAGLPPYPKDLRIWEKSAGHSRVIERVVGNRNLSRREAQVALFCAEGITNAEIGRKLSIGEQTVKFHLRNIYTKFGVRRRTELIFHLLVSDERSQSVKENLGGELKEGFAERKDG
jgi:DNA-binding CsgD family transcriptional regulator